MSIMDYSNEVIVVVTTIAAFIIAVLLAILYYIKCVLSRPASQKPADWTTNPSIVAKSPSSKSLSNDGVTKINTDTGDFIINPAVASDLQTSTNSTYHTKTSLLVDTELGTRYAGGSVPSKQAPAPVPSETLSPTVPSKTIATPSSSSPAPARESDGFSQFQFLDPSFASVVSGAPVNESQQNSSNATGSVAVEVRDDDKQVAEPIEPLEPSLTPAPIAPAEGNSTASGEDDAAEGTDNTPVLSEGEFDEAMTSKLMPPSAAAGAQKFSSEGLLSLDVQKSLAANKSLTAAERNTEYFKRMKEQEAMDHMRIAKMDPQLLLNKKIEMELKRAHENKKASHSARLGSMSLTGRSISISKSSMIRASTSSNMTPRDASTATINEVIGDELDT